MEQENQKTKTKYRISMNASVIIMFIATFFDLISLIPLAGDITAIIFWGIMGIYFWIKRMGIINGRRLTVAAISFVAEMIPVVQELPMLLAGIIAILFMIRIEDKTGMSLIKPMSKGVTPPRLTRNPFNKEGVRAPRQN